jgi:hypothetical protein
MGNHAARFSRELGPRELALANAVWNRMLRHRIHGDCGKPLRPRSIWNGADELLTTTG